MTSQNYGPKWLVERAQKCLKCDPHSAKALLITARTLHPQDFGIQFEAYCIEKSARNSRPASVLLLEMFEQFKQETALWKELQIVTGALKSNTDDENGLFLQEVFSSLPDKAQFDILLLSADHCSDILERCQLKLLLINRFPDAITEHGEPLVDMLLDAEKNEGEKLAVNRFRRVMVCEVLPVICASKKVNCQPKQYHKWLQKAVEFYTVYATQPAWKTADPNGTPKGPTAPLLSPQAGKGQSFGFGELTHPWEKLRQLLVMIADKCGWDTKFVPDEGRPFTVNWLHINEHYSRAKSSEAANVRKPVFYSTLVLFLQAVHGFMSAVDPEQFANSSTSPSHQPSLVLLEDLECKRRVKKHHKHAHKRRKLDTGEKEGDSDSSDDPVFHLPPATLRLNKVTGVTQEVVDMFQTAVDCWQLLSSNETFEKDFNWLLHRWKADTWPWFTAFQIDRFLFKAEFDQALRMLQEQYKKLSTAQQTAGNQVLKTLLQTAACYFRQSQHSSACEMTLNAVRHLPTMAKDTPHAAQSVATTEKMYNKNLRQLPLVPCTSLALLPYFVQLLLLSYKKKVFHLRDTEDTALGHMLVLMQYDWPKEEVLFQELIKKLKRQGSFSYPIFFQYIINIDMLEEFAFLKTETGGKLQLDLLPPNPSVMRQRTVTRNITKGGKEDFRIAMEKQVVRCGENLDALMRTFLTNERDSLQRLLM
ncbi:integrator complex subunit 10-like isoform X2 [Acanthaster planci]|uniref:Integrator complex subunit 10 n=1 Tax=Acanthaster planci TaxID=133434 RepID=A0A8B8A2I1_ACAPL|nr:integrator complex subunit 10-like isoform X2 [Acanthaster planci]